MVTLARFRMRNHRLAIEVGDWLSIPVENRVCYSCMEVEDEAHFVFECDRYRDLREQYVKYDYDVTRDSEEQLVEMLQCHDSKVLNNLAIYIRKAQVVHAEYADRYMAEIAR